MAGRYGALLNLLRVVLSAQSVALVVLLCMLRKASKVLICTLVAVFALERTRKGVQVRGDCRRRANPTGVDAAAAVHHKPLEGSAS
jgi:hypothetical protein